MDTIPIAVLGGLLIVLLCLSAFFSGSETALMTLNRYRLRHQADSGHAGARLAHALLQKPDRLIGLILLGNNFVNILASALVTLIALRLGGEGAIPIAAGLLTLIVLIFAEVAPKTFAALHPEKLAYPAAWIYTPLLRLLTPVVWLVNLVANSILRLLRLNPDQQAGDSLSREELRTVVNEADVLIPQRHRNMLLSILDLEQLQVEDIMVPRQDLEGVDITQPMTQILQRLQTLPYTRVLVYRHNIDQMVGTLHVRQVLGASLQHPQLDHTQLQTLLREPYYIPEGTSLHQQLHQFQRQKRRSGLIVDEYGDILGLLTMSDLLEQIVGEFTTVPTDDIPDIQLQDDNTFLVQGHTSVRELAGLLNWDLPLTGPKTLNGLIVEHLQNLPESGTSVRIAGVPIDILQTQDNCVKTAHIKP
ncbi:MAG: HlyC/CorC family transporter [Pseudomonadota bacterium]